MKNENLNPLYWAISAVGIYFILKGGKIMKIIGFVIVAIQALSIGKRIIDGEWSTILPG